MGKKKIQTNGINGYKRIELRNEKYIITEDVKQISSKRVKQ